MTARVEVSGLRELQSELKAANPKLARELTKAHKQVAMNVLAKAQDEMRSQPVGKAAEAAEGLSVSAGQKWAGVKLEGGNPFVRAVEFGASFHRVFGRWVRASSMRRRVYQPWKGNSEDAGYALYPTLRRVLPSPEFAEEYGEAIRKVYAKAFPETA
jgi:hypothetical protein